MWYSISAEVLVVIIIIIVCGRVSTFNCFYFSRIETFLPKQKQLWAESEEPLASKANKEKIKEFEKEQEVGLAGYG